MCMNVKSKVNSRGLYGKTFFISLLFIAVLFSSCFISIFNFSHGVSPFVSGTSNKVVNNETELRNAVNNAAGPVVIALNRDIQLTEPFIIPANKDITLTSNSATKFYKLIGTNYYSTINVTDRCVLKIDGIIVTHLRSSNSMYIDNGCGVTIDPGGTLIMQDGEISGNTACLYYSYNFGMDSLYYFGGGVLNWGTFEMTGGKIYNNSATEGGGIYNGGTFTISGGEITDNRANQGGGVYNTYNGIFNNHGGKIYDNIAWYNLNGDVYPNNSNGSSGGDSGGTSNGNNGLSDGNGNSGSNGDGLTGGGASNEDSFSLKEAMIISVGVVVVMVGIIVAIMFFYIQKRMTQIEEKIHSNTETQN